MQRQGLSIAFILQALIYNPETGAFTWRARPREWFSDERIFRSWNAKFAGKPAGSLHNKGYWTICFTIEGQREPVLAHDLAYAMMTGEWPPHGVDHFDRDKINNRWSNLRAATQAENGQNRGMHKLNTSGYPGVAWHKPLSKWRAQIGVSGRKHHLGYFDTREEAYEAYLKAKTERHTFHPV